MCNILYCTSEILTHNWNKWPVCRSTQGNHRWRTGTVHGHQPHRALPAHQSTSRSGFTSVSPLFQDLTFAESLFFTYLDLLKKSAPARIVNVSSTNHRKGEVDFSHFRGENLVYGMDNAYNHSKLHNVIWTNELARRLKGTGTEQGCNLWTLTRSGWRY